MHMQIFDETTHIPEGDACISTIRFSRDFIFRNNRSFEAVFSHIILKKIINDDFYPKAEECLNRAV